MISIVMPCYNCETSLVRTAECIRAQTVADWELIAVDDGSSDGTDAALDALARADARIRVIHQENGGVSRARNAGMAAARGEWLAFADADDVLPPDALATLLALDDGGADILCGAYTIRYTDEGGREEPACLRGRGSADDSGKPRPDGQHAQFHVRQALPGGDGSRKGALRAAGREGRRGRAVQSGCVLCRAELADDAPIGLSL